MVKQKLWFFQTGKIIGYLSRLIKLISKMKTFSYNFLWTLLDIKLIFSGLIDRFINKLSKSNGILYRIRDMLPMQARIQFYWSKMYLYLTYNIILWDNTHTIYIKPFIIQHKRIIRTLCNSDRKDNTTPLFRRLSLLKINIINTICI